MRLNRRNSRFLANAALAFFLVAAQWGAVVHAFEHETGKPLTQVCTTCVAASQLGAACIDSPTTLISVPSSSAVIFTVSGEFKSSHWLATRQRGPPLAC